MLKTVSSITNAIGALNYKGTWNASTNTNGNVTVDPNGSGISAGAWIPYNFGHY